MITYRNKEYKRNEGYDMLLIQGGLIKTITQGDIRDGQILIDEGKIVSIGQKVDAPVIPLQYLPLVAGLAIRYGMDEEDAWKAITINPAHVVGIDHRVGSLEAGKDADIAIFSGNPLREIQAQAVQVFVDGKPVL